MVAVFVEGGDSDGGCGGWRKSNRNVAVVVVEGSK